MDLAGKILIDSLFPDVVYGKYDHHGNEGRGTGWGKGRKMTSIGCVERLRNNLLNDDK